MVASKVEKRKKRPLLLTLVASVVLTLGTAGAVTYAWFVAWRTGRGDIGNIAVDGGLKLKVYSFTRNYQIGPDESGTMTVATVGYDDPTFDEPAYRIFNPVDPLAAAATDIFVNPADYEKIDEGHYRILKAADLNPGVRFTYAFVVENTMARAVEVVMTAAAFTADYSPTMAEADKPRTKDASGNERYIYLSEAIDMMAVSALYAEDDDTLTLVKDFLTDRQADMSRKYTDYFRTKAASADPTDIDEYGIGGVRLYDKDANPPLLIPAGAKGLFLFTVEFSDDESTFYYRDADDGYYYPGTATDKGNSNVYQNAVFSLDSLAFRIIGQ